jgi:hypothetical protein
MVKRLERILQDWTAPTTDPATIQLRCLRNLRARPFMQVIEKRGPWASQRAYFAVILDAYGFGADF